MEKGYIYVRQNIYYDMHNAYKIGKASNIPERDSQYATGEIERGKFVAVYEVLKKQMGFIEKAIHYNFKENQVYINGGTEFFAKEVLEKIEIFLIQQNIVYRELKRNEIESLTRTNRLRETFKKIDKKKLIELLRKNEINPRPYQEVIIKNSVKYFEEKEKGILVLMCGVGKTLISLFIAKKLKSKSIVVGVPNCLLLNQWEEVIKKMYEGYPVLVVASGVSIVEISDFVLKNEKFVILTTYSSSFKIENASRTNNYTFDLKILDEVHHLTSKNMEAAQTQKSFVQILNVKSRKQLSLTATLKYLEGEEKQKVVSNENVEIFGEVIEKRSLLWAIENKVICDYKIQTIVVDEEKMSDYFEKYRIEREIDKTLFLSAISSLKSISMCHSHHLLIYCNSMENSEKLQIFIKLLLEKKEFNELTSFFSSSYDSDKSEKEQKNILEKFKESEKGILSCVYCLGEGWDFPLLDGVVFAENMSSIIRIVQSALRASRKNKEDENKIAKIILPILIKDDDFLNETKDFQRVKEVIYQMGIEDDSIIHKLFVSELDIPTIKKPMKKRFKSSETSFEIDDELTKKLRLKTMSRDILGSISYEKAKNILKRLEIESKKQYFEYCRVDKRFPINPSGYFKEQFKGWIDYLGIEKNYYNLETCKEKVKEEILKTGKDIFTLVETLCEEDKNFPAGDLWLEYYNVENLSEICETQRIRKKINVII
jgi:superfamily II DNA or RNA helicase